MAAPDDQEGQSDQRAVQAPEIDLASTSPVEGTHPNSSSPDVEPIRDAPRGSSGDDAAVALATANSGRSIDLTQIHELLAAVAHPSLPAAHYIGRHPNLSVDLLFLEYDATGEWLPALSLGSSDICRLGGQIAQTLDSVHRAGFVLMSLRADTVRWSPVNARATIARLDGVTPLGQEGRARSWGAWTSPETTTGQPAAPSADVFSLGMILATALGAATHDVEASIDVEWTTPDDTNLDLLSIAMRCAQGEASDRPALSSVALELGRIRSLLTAEWAVETTKGRVREVQEDSWLAVTMGGASEEGGIGLFLVADGMGGMSAGEVASSLAVRTFGQVMLQSVSGHASESDAQTFTQALGSTAGLHTRLQPPPSMTMRWHTRN